MALLDVIREVCCWSLLISCCHDTDDVTIDDAAGAFCCDFLLFEVPPLPPVGLRFFGLLIGSSWTNLAADWLLAAYIIGSESCDWSGCLNLIGADENIYFYYVE